MIQVLFLHSSWAADSLLIAERGLTGESPEEEAPFESDHAKTIIELSTDVSEKLVKNEGERMIRFILDVCPHAPVST